MTKITPHSPVANQKGATRHGTRARPGDVLYTGSTLAESGPESPAGPRLARLAEIADEIRELTHEQALLLKELAGDAEEADHGRPRERPALRAAAELRQKTGTSEGDEQ